MALTNEIFITRKFITQKFLDLQYIIIFIYLYIKLTLELHHY